MSNVKYLLQRADHNGISAHLYIVFVEGKGGVGKSFTGMTVHHALSADGSRVAVIETDTTNSTMYSVGLTSGDPISTRDETMLGGLLEGVALIADGEADHIVLDAGARDEAFLLPHLAKLAQRLRQVGGHLVVVRPLTTSHFVLSNAAECANTLKGTGISLIYSLGLWGGRTRKDYQGWIDSPYRQAALADGAVEIEVSSIGTVVADNMVGFGLSIMDVADQNFGKAGEHEAVARKVFTRPMVLHCNEWLDDHVMRVRAGLIEALRRPL
jgi:hypothetical protein